MRHQRDLLERLAIDRYAGERYVVRAGGAAPAKHVPAGGRDLPIGLRAFVAVGDDDVAVGVEAVRGATRTQLGREGGDLAEPFVQRGRTSVPHRGESLEPGGHVIVGTFVPDGPERCSGLDVVRHDGPGLAAALGPSFALIEAIRHEHVTPAGKVQPFTFARLVRVGG